MKTAQKTSAVVLGADTNGLGHVRSLGKMGIFTYVVCSGRDVNNVARFSKYSVAVLVPDNAPDYQNLLRFKLVELAENVGSELVLFATSDFFVNFISLNQEELRKHYLFNIPAREVLKLIVSKYEIVGVAHESGLRAPGTLKLNDAGVVDAVAGSFGFPCIVKPEDSYSHAFPGKNKIIETRNELTTFIDSYPELSRHCIAQEIIEGDEKNIFQCTAYIGKHVPTQLFTMQKIHQRPPGFGVATLGRSRTIVSLMKETEKFLKHIRYTGFASVEFKKSDKDFQHYLIEVNPRLPWYNAMFLSSGVNFPYLAYLDLTGAQVSTAVSGGQRDDVYWIHFRHEIASLMKRRAESQSLNLLEGIKLIFKARSFAYFDPYDLKPYFMAVIGYVLAEIRKFFSRRKPGYADASGIGLELQDDTTKYHR